MTSLSELTDTAYDKSIDGWLIFNQLVPSYTGDIILTFERERTFLEMVHLPPPFMCHIGAGSSDTLVMALMVHWCWI